MRTLAGLLLACALWPAHAADRAGPSRPPGPRCAWEKLADADVGLAAWVQRCDYGYRRIDFLFDKRALAIRYSDGGPPDPLVEVIDLEPGESAEAGMHRVFIASTAPAVARRCVLARARGKAPPGVNRYTFVPNAAYRKVLRAQARPDEVPDPACGDRGDAPDGIQYFETHPSSTVRKILFVRVGQDTPLFDEQSLRLIAPAGR
jgi:hypothetical protein